jgi:hypothetical protein
LTVSDKGSSYIPYLFLLYPVIFISTSFSYIYSKLYSLLKYCVIIFLVAEYSKNIYHVTEKSAETLDADVWDKLKKLVAKKDEAVIKAEANAKEAM